MAKSNDRRVFRAKPFLPLLLIFVGVILLAFGLYMTTLAFPAPGEKSKMAGWEIALLVTLFGVLPAGGGLALIVWMATYLGMRVEVSTEDITARRWYGTRNIPWTSLRAFWWNANGTYMSGANMGSARYTFVDHKGGRIRFLSSFLINGIEVGPTVEPHIRRVVTPMMAESIAADESVAFGPLTVTPEGLRHREKTISFEELAQIELVDGGRVVVRQHDGWSVWFGSNMSRIPNIPALFALVGKRMVSEGMAEPVKEETPEPDAIADNDDWGKDVETLADLGPPIHTCHPLASKTESIIGAWIAFGLAAVVTLVALYGAFVGKWFTSPSMPVHIILGLVGFFDFFLIYGGITSLRTARQASYRIEIFPLGFIHIENKHLWVCPWRRVRHVWQAEVRNRVNGQFVGTDSVYTIERDDGEKRAVSSTDLKQVARFGEELLKQTHARLRNEAIELLRAGEAVEFGKVRVSKKGVRFDDAVIPWAQFDGARMNNGVLEIHQSRDKGIVLRCMGAEIPNLAVLLEVLDRVAESRAK